MEQFVYGDYSNGQKEDNKPTYCDLLNDDLYIAQFLNVNDMNLDISQQVYHQPIVRVFQSEPEKQIQEQPIEAEKCQKKRSTFHNFQKHLITTIRSLVDTSKFTTNSQTSLCEKKIWKIFINSNKINKTLVTMIVGNLNLENSAKINQYGFKQIIRQFKSSIIEQAQKNIYCQLLKQLNEADLAKELQNRRMKNKKQFIVYFRAFLKQLENNQLQKRMAKCTKLLKNQDI